MEESIQDMPVPLKPEKDERKWVRKSYNWGGMVQLLAVALMNVGAIATVVIAAVAKRLQPGMTDQSFLQYINNLDTDGFIMLLANLVGALVAYPAVFFIGCKALEIRPKSFFSTKGISARLVVSGIVVALAAQLVGGILANLVTQLGKNFGWNFTTFQPDTQGGFASNLLLVLLSCVSAPIFEELIFRGLVLRAFSKVSIRFGIVMSAVLFGCFHQNIPQAVNASVLGLVLGYVSYKAGSVLPAILIHFVYNANAILQTLAADHFGEIISALFVLAWVLAALAGGLIAIILNRRRIFVPKTTPFQKKRTLPLFVTSWGVWVVLAVYAGFTLLSIKPI